MASDNEGAELVEAFSFSTAWTKTILLAFITATLALWVTLRRQNKISKRGETLVDKLPGPMAFPVLGNALNLRVQNEDFNNLIGDLGRKWGGLLRVWYFNNPWIIVTSADDVQNLYSSPSAKHLCDKTDEIDITKRVIGTGLYNRDANIYHERRKLLNQGYGISLIRKSIPKINYRSALLVKSFKRFAETGESVNTYPIMINSAIQLIWDSLFAKNYEEDAPKDVTDYAKAMNAMSFHHTNRIFQPWLRTDFIFNLTQGAKLAEAGIHFLNDFGKKSVRERREIWQIKRALTKPTKEDGVDKDWECYLDFLFELEEKGLLTEQDVVNEFAVFTVGGYETTGITLTNLLFLLAHSPEKQKKVVEELDEIFGKGFDASNFQVTMNEVKQMKYLDFCLKEALRIYPPLSMSPKKVTEDILLDDGRVIPAGVQLFVSMYWCHRDPKYFPKPEEFIPERFSPDSEFYKEKGSYAYIPFSVSPRNCIGQNYGIANLKVYLAYLLKAYEWTAVTPRERLKMTYQYTSHPKNIFMKLKPRI
ncbi:unnamed protein product [Orchesella dallaii]|uniref:Uncharacterized protein n=1 Tax=Orchesella dallaii TaxID=48710 RepID=A0ABP1RFW7_9HEXA